MSRYNTYVREIVPGDLLLDVNFFTNKVLLTEDEGMEAIELWSNQNQGIIQAFLNP